MYFTSGQDRAFERLMQEKPGFDHYDGGGANAPEDCGSCHFYRPDWKYQYCVYAECPYQPGKLTALAAVKFTVKGADDDMAVFRVEKNKGYTVMSNHHLRNKALSLKAKGLLSQKSLFRVVENGEFLNRLRNGHLEKSAATGLFRPSRSPKTAKTPRKVHLRLRFQNLGKPRTAGLSGWAAGACDCGPLSCYIFERGYHPTKHLHNRYQRPLR